MSTEAVAIIGFVVLFVLMLLRVPVGMAMGLVGVSGFAYLNGGGPALKIVGHTSMRTVTDWNFAVIPMFQSDRKSTRLNSSHQIISYAVFCLKKKNARYPAAHSKVPAFTAATAAVGAT